MAPKILALLFILLFVAQSATTQEADPVSYSETFGNCVLRISETGFGVTMTLERSENIFLSISNISYIERRMPGIWERELIAEEIRNYTRKGDEIAFLLETGADSISGDIALSQDGLMVRFSREADENDILSADFKNEGLWYGGGSLLEQQFPLESVDLLPLNDIVSRGLPEFLHPAAERALPFLYEKIFPLLMNFAPSFYAFMGLESSLMMTRPLGYNFQTPFWLSSESFGVFLNTTQPIHYSLENSLLHLGLESGFYEAEIILGETPMDVYSGYTGIVGNPSKVIPEDVISGPIWTIGSQYSTDFDQESVLAYARRIEEANLPHSVITIDVGWQKNHGDTNFDLSRFSDPKGMVEELHDLGFKVILWITPYVSCTSSNYRTAMSEGYLIEEPLTGLPIHVPWSYLSQIVFDFLEFDFYSVARGVTKPLFSVVIDLSNPEAFGWYLSELEELTEMYGIDGFKMDQGEGAFLPNEGKTFGNITKNEYSDLCTSLGADFDYYEIRTGWFSQSHGGWVREYDKFSTWDSYNGLKSVVPEALTLSILGYPYILPDVVGGGEFFVDNELGEELYIRWAQLESFMPVMQFSDNYFKQSERARELSRSSMEIHEDLSPYLIELAEGAAENGSPIIRPLFFHYPDDEECFHLDDEYMIGAHMIVAPVIEAGARSREVYLPEGIWFDYWDGTVFEGGWITYEAPLEKIPVFVDSSY